MRKLGFWCVVLALQVGCAFANEVVKLAIGEWVPFTSEADPKSKLLEKVVSEAFKLEGMEVQYDYFPWKRSYLTVEKGEHDGTFPWNRTEERDRNFVLHKQSLVKDDSVYFHLKTTAFKWDVIEDLRQYRVGSTLGYRNEATYKEKGIPFESVATEELNFKKMLLGRVDVYGTSKIVGYATINKLFTPQEAKLFTHHPKPYSGGEYFILFSKVNEARSKTLADKFDAGLKKLKASGGYDRIFAH